jgi:signal transduction histidine kinase
MMLRAIHTLAQFARLASDSASGPPALQLLADTLVEQTGCDAAAVFQVTGPRLVLSASCNVPERLRAWSGDADDADSTLGRLYLKSCAGEFVEAETMLLVSSGGLFGVVVVLWKKPHGDAEPWQRELAEGLIDLAATILATSAHVQELVRANDELRRSRDILARTERLRALGQMAAGVSHDLKNLLNPLSLHLQLAQRANVKGDREQVDAGLGAIKEAVNRGVDVLERLRNFSRQTPDAKAVPVDLSARAREAVQLAKPRLVSKQGRVIRVHEEYGEPPVVAAEPSEIVSAVLNLLANAGDAMADGGEVFVRTGEREGGGYIEVRDTGPGMSAETKAKVFEPFFTTKGETGTGLGLAMVYAMINRHRGTVTLESEPGQGATFTLWFPALA